MAGVFFCATTAGVAAALGVFSAAAGFFSTVACFFEGVAARVLPASTFVEVAGVATFWPSVQRAGAGAAATAAFSFTTGRGERGDLAPPSGKFWSEEFAERADV